MQEIDSSNDQHRRSAAEIVATRVTSDLRLNAAAPASEWHNATPVTFCSDWQGMHSDMERQTSVSVLWSLEMLYVRFVCRYRELHMFKDAEPNGRRNRLWERDVAEVFLQPDRSQLSCYKEFEIAPNGLWLDLDVAFGVVRDLNSNLNRSVSVNAQKRRWAAELAIPMPCLTSKFDPSLVWFVNFFRVEGIAEPRAYHAWQPTHAPTPNFHVPSAFGSLRFV
ncbi:carbohydrate-binding family 9-like protein [Edaphobacter bradus]|uniref:carbohydrate-binding family 9-like protein n=1 Tax=Edaphobacter bradus TaxID=2259016 RepID=UPI0021E05E1C|nr:carbohydrate-binding family 9-like protein [Edaphobacter bradus]